MALLLLAAGCGDAEPALPFSAAEVVSSRTTVGATPMFAVSTTGRQVLSWVAPDPVDSVEQLHVQVRAPDGSLHESVVRDPLGSIEPHGEAPPQVVATDASIYALYTVGRDVGKRFPESALRLVRSDDGGVTWSAPVAVNEGPVFGSHNFHALLAGTGGTVYAAWLSNVAGTSGVMLRVSRDGGRTWEPTLAAHEAPTCPCCRTGLALGADGSLYASWRKIFDGDVRDVVVARSPDGGHSWQEPIRPRQDNWVFPGCPHAGPSLKIDADGVVHIAWWTGAEGEAGVWYARSRDQGATWHAAPIATGARSLPAHVQVAIGSDGLVLVAYDDGLGERPVVRLAVSRDGGQSFGEPLTLSDRAVAGTYPVLAIAGDSVMVAWSQVVDSAYRAGLAEREAMSGPGARMALPRVGQQEVVMRRAALADLFNQ